MRILLFIALLICSVPLLSQDLQSENKILKANYINISRFNADSIKVCFLIVKADSIVDLIKYDNEKLRNHVALKRLSKPNIVMDTTFLKNVNKYARDSIKLKLIDKVTALFNDEAIIAFKANSLNYFIGTPMSHHEYNNLLNISDKSFESKLVEQNVDIIIVRLENYYINGNLNNSEVLAIAPIANEKNKEHILFWVYIHKLADDKTAINFFNRMICNDSLKLIEGKDY